MTQAQIDRHDKIAFLVTVFALGVALIVGTVVMMFGKVNRSNSASPAQSTSGVTVVKTSLPTIVPTLTPANVRAPQDATPRWQNVPTSPAQTPLAMPPNHPGVDGATCESCHGNFRQKGK